jgi:hypothetical protein
MDVDGDAGESDGIGGWDGAALTILLSTCKIDHIIG